MVKMRISYSTMQHIRNSTTAKKIYESTERKAQVNDI
jgi:hypothetical protein